MQTGKLLVAGAAAVFAFGCFGSGGSDGSAGDGASAGVGAGMGGASGSGAAGSGSGGTGVVTGTGGTSGNPKCGLCSVPECAPGETPEQGAEQCCPSCAIVGGGGTGGTGTTGDAACEGKVCGATCAYTGCDTPPCTGGPQQGYCDPSGNCDLPKPVCSDTGTETCNNCPDTPPTAGAPCEPCAAVPSCTYNDCAGTGRTVAQCLANAWHVTTEACDVTDCDGLKCGDGVCLLVQGQAAGDRRCAADPCVGSVLTCECAASICDGEFGATECRISGPNQVSCYATTSGCTPDGICPP